MTFGEFLGVVFWDSVFIGVTAIVMRIRHWRRHHHVPHRKLRAGHIACRARMDGAAVRTSGVQPPPAPDTVGSIPGAGTNLGPLPVGRDRTATPRAGRRHELPEGAPGRAPTPTRSAGSPETDLADTPQGPSGVFDPGPEAQTAAADSRMASARAGLGLKQAAEGDMLPAAPGTSTPSSGLEARTVAPPSGGPGPHTPVDVTTSETRDVHRAPARCPA